MLEHQNEHMSWETSSNFDHVQRQYWRFPKAFSWGTSEFAASKHSKSEVSCQVPSTFTSHKMPGLSWNLRLGTTSRSPDTALRKKHATRLL